MTESIMDWNNFKVFGQRYFEDEYMKTNFDNFDELNRRHMFIRSKRLSMLFFNGKPNLHHMISQPMYSNHLTRHLIPYNVAKLVAPQPAYRALCIHNPVFAIIPTSIFAWAMESLSACDRTDPVVQNTFLQRLIEERRPKWYRNRFGIQGDYLNMGQASQIYTNVTHVMPDDSDKLKSCPTSFKE